MSAAITAYAIDLNALRRAVGSGDVALAARVRRANMNSADRRRVQDLLYFGAGDMSWSDGGYALEALCRALGRELPCEVMGRLGYDAAPRLAALDALLDALGVTLSWGAVYGASGPPVALTGEPGWPRVFHLDAAPLATAHRALTVAMAPAPEIMQLRQLMARARRDQAPREIINGLQRWLAAWPLFGVLRGLPSLAGICELPADSPLTRERWELLEPTLETLDDLDWRAAALLEETAAWVSTAAKGSAGLVGFEY